jgi:dienelactone hydrolase
MKKTAALLFAILLACAAPASAAPDPDFHIYLAFGQSNMEGGGAMNESDRTVDKRFQVMADFDNPARGWKFGQWYDAVPPLTRRVRGISMMDYFGRTMVANLPPKVRVGLIKLAVSGTRIELWDKDAFRDYLAGLPADGQWKIPLANEYDGNPYEYLIRMAKLAQKDGVIRGILIHQGESNSRDNQWPVKVKKVYADIIKDLGLNPADVPLLAGEVVNADQDGKEASANEIMKALPGVLANSYVISSAGVPANADRLHFTADGQREMGRRYAMQMLKVQGYMPVIKDPNAQVPDTRGTGRYAAMKEEDPSLPNHVVYRPAKLNALGSRKLGVYIFGNGACSNDGASSRLHLLEVASHGYLAIAPGRIRSGPGATAPLPPAPASKPRPADGSPVTMAARPTSQQELITALDWALAQNRDPRSPYYGKIDPKAVAMSGYSCGAFQALLVASDPRIRTVIVMNSGIYNPGTEVVIDGMEGLTKDLLAKLHTPTFYVLGGETDIAYPNGIDDFRRISGVPAFMGNVLKAGHAGTYWEPHGGKAAAAVVAWLDWQLRGDRLASRQFVGKDCGLCRDTAWAVEKRKIN